MNYKQKLLIGFLFVIFISPCVAEDRALLVGIDTYWYASPLKGSKEDVKAMQRFIKKVWGYKDRQIRLLTDNKATKKGILKAFDNWLIKGSQPGDNVLFYYSGHGYYVWDDNNDENDGYDETLCPVETDATAKTMIRDDEIEARLRRLKKRQVTIIVDACHSGTVTRSIFEQTRPNPTLKIPVFRPPKRSGLSLTRSLKPEGFISSRKGIVAYSAVAPNQVALVDIEKPYRGLFTSRFIQGVEKKEADKNHDGKVTHTELLEYLRHESQAYCERQPKQCQLKALSPQLEASPDLLAADVRSGKVPSQTNNTAEQATALLTHDNTAQLEVKILRKSNRLGRVEPQNRFKVNDMMQIQIRSQHSGYFLLFDINSEGKLTRLFPNEFAKQSYVKAGQIVIIPDKSYGFDFVAGEPLGKGLLIALVVEDHLARVQELLPEAFEQIQAQQAQTVLQQLRQQLNRTLPQEIPGEGTVNRPIRWSIAVVDYEIVRRQRGLRGNLELQKYFFANRNIKTSDIF